MEPGAPLQRDVTAALAGGLIAGACVHVLFGTGRILPVYGIAFGTAGSTIVSLIHARRLGQISARWKRLLAAAITGLVTAGVVTIIAIFATSMLEARPEGYVAEGVDWALSAAIAGLLAKLVSRFLIAGVLDYQAVISRFYVGAMAGAGLLGVIAYRTDPIVSLLVSPILGLVAYRFLAWVPRPDRVKLAAGLALTGWIVASGVAGATSPLSAAIFASSAMVLFLLDGGSLLWLGVIAFCADEPGAAARIFGVISTLALVGSLKLDLWSGAAEERPTDTPRETGQA